MINYLKSEMYRLKYKKSLYLTTIIGLLLIGAAAIVLNFFGKYDPNFLYAKSIFFYSNVVSSAILILIIGLIFNGALTGKDASLTKQSVSFGISRNTIFWSKLILTLSSFIVLCVIGLLFTIGLGESFFATEDSSMKNFLIACLNMVPIILSGFFVIHALKMLKVGDVYIIIILLVIFSFSDNLLRGLFRSVSGLNELYKYTPSTLLSENLMNFVDHAAQLDVRYWLTGLIISVIALFFGAKMYAKQNID